MPGFLLRQRATAARTANAVRPVPGYQATVPSMAAGWLTSELAPHLLTLTVGDPARELPRGHRDRPALLLAAGSAIALAAVAPQSARAQEHVDEALVDALGPDYCDRLSATYT